MTRSSSVEDVSPREPFRQVGRIRVLIHTHNGATAGQKPSETTQNNDEKTNDETRREERERVKKSTEHTKTHTHTLFQNTQEA